MITISVGILLCFWAFFAATYLLATEYISSSKSKGEVLVFRRGHVSPKKISEDEETGRTSTTMSGDEPVDVDSVAAIQRQVATFHWEDVVYDIEVSGLRNLFHDISNKQCRSRDNPVGS